MRSHSTFPLFQADDVGAVAREHDREFLPNNSSYLDAELRLQESDLPTVREPERVLRA